MWREKRKFLCVHYNFVSSGRIAGSSDKFILFEKSGDVFKIPKDLQGKNLEVKVVDRTKEYGASLMKVEKRRKVGCGQQIILVDARQSDYRKTCYEEGDYVETFGKGLKTLAISENSQIPEGYIGFPEGNASTSFICDNSIIEQPILGGITNSKISNSMIFKNDKFPNMGYIEDSVIDFSEIGSNNSDTNYGWTIYNSQVFNSTVRFNSLVSYSTVNNSDIIDSDVYMSDISNSILDNAFSYDDWNDNGIRSKVEQSTISNSGVSGALVTRSFVNENSGIDESEIFDSSVTDSELFQVKASNHSTFRNSEANGFVFNNSHLVLSTLNVSSLDYYLKTLVFGSNFTCSEYNSISGAYNSSYYLKTCTWVEYPVPSNVCNDYNYTCDLSSAKKGLEELYPYLNPGK